MLRRALVIVAASLIVSTAVARSPLDARAQQAQPALAPGTSVTLPGVRLWVRDSGGSGAPVVLLHASTGTSDAWEHQFQEFARAGYRVIAPDRRGAGSSVADPATGPQPGTAADDLQALAAHLRLGRFHLVGLAGGGFIALDYAASFPDRLSSLVVAASTGGLEDKVMADARQSIRWPGFDSLDATFREVGPSYRVEHPDGVARWAAIERRAQPTSAAQPMRTRQTLAKIEAIKTRTLIIAGGADLIAPPALMRMWAGHIAGAKFVVIPEAGHAVAWERPEQFNREVLAFLGQR
jgi:pimeloyl-ACP methyl ester carboxylesterase